MTTRETFKYSQGSVYSKNTEGLLNHYGCFRAPLSRFVAPPPSDAFPALQQQLQVLLAPFFSLLGRGRVEAGGEVAP